VHDGELVHADRHGAVVIPHDVAAKIPAVNDLLTRREAVILGAARKPDFSFAVLREALSKAEEIH
jgi:regulator of RNase E activity RraA